MFGNIFVFEIWAKMFLANQIAGFFNQPYLQNKSMKSRFHGKTFLPPKLEEMGQKWPKIGFFEFK